MEGLNPLRSQQMHEMNKSLMVSIQRYEAELKAQQKVRERLALRCQSLFRQRLARPQHIPELLLVTPGSHPTVHTRAPPEKDEAPRRTFPCMILVQNY